MKVKIKFYKKWSETRSKGIFKYLLKDIVIYILVITSGIILGGPIIILVRHILLDESISVSFNTTLKNISTISIIKTSIIIPCIILLISTLNWYINEYKFKKMNGLQRENITSKK